MGNPASKLFKSNKSDIVVDEISTPEPELPTTPTQTIPIDPRSPSIEIVRTPIEKNYLEEHPHEFTTHTPCSKPALDPRSPSIEITRTPILLQNNPVVQIKNTDDIRRKLLKGNTIKKLTQSTEDILAETRRQGVLETDLDFIETDIDLVYQRNTTKYLQDKLKIETNYFSLEDPRSPSYGIDRTPIQLPKTQDPRSPTEEFVRTPIVLESSFEEKLDSLTLADTLLVEVTPKVQKGLIYEDDCEQVVTPSRKVTKDGRTPLGVRNGSQVRSKSANGRLLQNYEVGKIPIYNKNIKKMKAKKIQCENTPPQVLKRRNGSGHQWDGTDSTLII